LQNNDVQPWGNKKIKVENKKWDKNSQKHLGILLAIQYKNKKRNFGVSIQSSCKTAIIMIALHHT
jgi:hypothetical protein